MEKILKDFFLEKGYEEIKNSGFVFVKEDVREVYVIRVIKITQTLDEEIILYEEQRQQMILYWSTKEVRMLDLLIVDDMNDKSFTRWLHSENTTWVLDKKKCRVLLFEAQKDFDHLYQPLEQWLDEKNSPVKQPITTWGIILLNTLIFLLTMRFNEIGRTYIFKIGALDWKAVFYDQEYYRFLTSQFLHFGWKHFLNNMVILGLAGFQLEPRIGNWRFLILYLVSGVIGGMSSVCYFMYHQDMVISVGASGAIYGVLGAILVDTMCEKRQMREILFRSIVIIGGSFYLMLDDISIDYMAHVGGFLGGAVFQAVCLMIAFKYNVKYKRKMK